MKERIITTPILALSDLQRVFKLETNASLYVMGAFLMQHKKPICYHFETFSKEVDNYTTYDKDLYELVQSVKTWKHYLMGKKNNHSY